MTTEKMKNLKLLVGEAECRIESFQKEIDREITNNHIHLTDGISCIAVRCVKAEMWQLNEAKEILETIEKELEEKT